MILSVVAGSVAFTGSTAGVDSISAESPDELGNDIDEDTEETREFRYNITGVNTTGKVTVTLIVPPEFDLTNVDNVELQNATGDVLNDTQSADSNGREITLSANADTENVFLDGTIDIRSPSVNSDQRSRFKLNASDADGENNINETIEVINDPLAVSSITSLNPTSDVDEETERQYDFNYTFTGVTTADDTNYTVDVPSEFSIEDSDVAVKNASGDQLTDSVQQSGNELILTTGTNTERVYLDGSVNLTSPAVPEGKEQADYDITLRATEQTLPPSRSVETTETVTIDFVGGQAGDPELESAIQYEQSDDTPAVEVAFSEDVENFDDSNFDLYVEGEGRLSSSQISASEAQGRAVITLDQSYGQPMTLRLEDGIQDTDGNALVDTGNTSVRFAPTSVTANEDVTAYQGANVSIVAASSNTGVQIEGTESDTNDYFFDGSTGTNSRIFVFATDDRNAGDYEADIEGESTADITVRGLGLSVDIDDRNVTNLQNLEGTVEARSGGRPVRLEFLDEDGESVDEVDDRIVSLSGQGEYEFSYDLESLEVETGEYTIRATDTTSGVTVESDNIVVREAGDTEATFPDGTITEARGDVAAIPIELDNTREATLTVGGENLGFESNVTVRDDDQDGDVTVYFNTYAASTASEGDLGSNNDVFSVGDDDEVVSSDLSIGVSNLLDAESYDMSLDAEGRETDIDLLVLEPRETTAIRTWTAPQNRYGDLDAASDVREGDGEWLTRTDEVATGDTVVYEIQASGLEGPLDARNEDTVTSEFYDFANGSESDPAAGFAVAQQDPGPNQNPLLLQLNGSNSRVVADSANDSYYVITRTGADGPSAVEDDDDDGAIDPDETDYGQVSTDDDLRASFTVFGDDENDLDLTTDGDDEVVETTHSLTDPELSMSEPFNVTEASGQEVFGEATVAPGTEIRVRVRSGDNVRPAFLKTAETTVDGDGQFLVTLSFNDTSPGDRYNVVVDDTGPASEISIEGTVQPVIQTPTTDTPAETTVITSTATPTTTTSTPTTTTSTPVTTTTEIPTVQTPTTTPGFGVVAALVALAAAALLALRRE
jgi:PGF-CTERM protein